MHRACEIKPSLDFSLLCVTQHPRRELHSWGLYIADNLCLQALEGGLTLQQPLNERVDPQLCLCHLKPKLYWSVTLHAVVYYDATGSTSSWQCHSRMR